MKEEVKIYSSMIPLSERLFLSSGTIAIKGFDANVRAGVEHFYRGGFVPSTPWRAVTDPELEILQTRRVPTSLFDTIGIYKIPPALLHESKKIGIDQLQSQTEAMKYNGDKCYEEFMNKLLTYLESYMITENEFEIKGLMCSRLLGLKGSTYDYKDGKLPGLHIDSWDALTWDSRKKARNRICINFGKEERYFVFINLNISTVIDLVISKKEDAEYPKINTAFNVFFELYPDYPVVKIQLEPGEFYIAPTENILHDASTEGKIFPDISLTFLGYFNVCPVR